MKKFLGAVALMTLCFAANAQNSTAAKTERPGIQIAEQRTKTNVYEIRLQNLSTQQQAQALDDLLLSRQGIFSSHTQLSTRICRVEALKEITEHQLRELVGIVGLQVSKTFND